VFAGVVAFVVLATIGAALGWWLTPVPKANAGAPPGPTASSSSPATSPSPAQPTPSVSTPPQNGDSFLIPDYARLGETFEDARHELRAHRLGVDLVFLGNGNDQTVNRTKPAAGQSVSPGATVKLYVNGVAPLLPVPPVPPNTTCQQWGSQLVDLGFRIAKYDGNRSKVVTAESPDETDPTTVWNQAITLTCGDHGNPSPSPSNPSPAPSSSGGK